MWRLSYLMTFQWISVSQVIAGGLLLMYRPMDISNDCVYSRTLRYDLSFGMGMSDTITLVFRTMNEIDYECVVKIVTEPGYDLVVVIKFPINVGTICAANNNAFVFIKNFKCLNLCSSIMKNFTKSALRSMYFTTVLKTELHFRFASNSNINADLSANLYQVTATSARQKPKNGCNNGNETICSVYANDYCFTCGVVCDGIKNCGVADWFDERKGMCGLPVERLGFAPVLATMALIFCVLLAASHILLHFLPSSTKSYFVFNADEDNRLCIDPNLLPPEHTGLEIQRPKESSLIPVSSCSSSENEIAEATCQEIKNQDTEDEKEHLSESLRRTTTVKTVTEIIQHKIRGMTGRRKSETKITIE